jgi:hypothetical protein
MSKITWTLSNGASPAPSTPKLPYVGTWAHFSKLPDDEKSKIFNSMRAALLSNGMMEQK